jgi:hypothetical protein
MKPLLLFNLKLHQDVNILSERLCLKRHLICRTLEQFLCCHNSLIYLKSRDFFNTSCLTFLWTLRWGSNFYLLQLILSLLFNPEAFSNCDSACCAYLSQIVTSSSITQPVNTCLRSNQAFLSYHCVMTYMHLIINFSSFANDGITSNPFVNCCKSTNAYIIITTLPPESNWSKPSSLFCNKRHRPPKWSLHEWLHYLHYGVVINWNIRMYYTISTNNDMISYESIRLYYSSLTHNCWSRNWGIRELKRFEMIR